MIALPYHARRLTLTLGRKLFLVMLALIALSVAAADAYLTPRIATHMTDSIRRDLVVRARLVAREASAFAHDDSDIAAWDALADQLGVTSGARVTIIGRDGAVLGDSEVPAAELSSVENHASRPEVVDALTRGVGTSERLSATVKHTMLYVAVPFDRGVSRVAEPLAEVDAAIADVRRLVWIGSALALGLAVVLSGIVAGRVSSAVGSLTSAARKMTAGDFEVRTRVRGGDELAQLGTALDRLAESLASTLADLRQERDLLGRILDGMEEGVLVIDGDRRVLTVNPALRSMLMLGADAPGKLVAECVRHARLEEHIDRVREERSVGALEIDVPGIKPRRLLVRAARLEGADLLLVFVDVTDVRRLEAMRRDFVANASHELRTPIAAVRSAAETLRTGALSDPAAAPRFLDIIERNAQRLQDLVVDLLELSKIESSELRLKRERVDAAAVAQIVLGLHRDRADKKSVRVTSSVPASTAVDADPRGLEHVLSNLVDNAIEYCAPGASVEISAAADGDDRVRIAVTDTGPGIAAEHLPRLFERFYRVDTGRSRDLGGTGLGLSIVKHLVEGMRGRVAVRSEVGKGSSFSVTLPHARD